MSLSDEAARFLSEFDASEECSYFTDGCCGDPDDHDYCGMCPLATAEHPDRNGGYPGRATKENAQPGATGEGS